MSEVLSRSRFSIYDAVTKKIVDAIELGVGTYKMPWHSPGKPVGLPTNAATYAEYRGVNVLSLWIAALSRGYPSGEWATYKQWRDLGAQVRKGEQGTLIVFYKQLELSALDEQDPEQRVARRYFVKPSWVFNIAQCDGYTPAEVPNPTDGAERCELADAFVTATGALVEHGYNMACYAPRRDAIQMPNWEWFLASATSTAAENYYAVLLHELTHWTGAVHRLNRTVGKRFGDDAYAVEELVAEIGSAFLCAALGISPQPREDHAAYIGAWLKIMKADNRAIFTAATLAQEAYDYLTARVTRNETPAATTA